MSTRSSDVPAGGRSPSAPSDPAVRGRSPTAPFDPSGRERSSAGAADPAVRGRSPAAPDSRSSEGRLGGARADFVASLGRKVNDARELLLALADDPSSKQARDELRRRLHALGAGARLLRFIAMAHSIQEALAVLERAAVVGTLREEEIAFVAQAVDDLPALAWGESPSPGTGRAAAGEERSAAAPVAVLVVGPEALAGTLIDDGPLGPRSFECERTDETRAALELARAHAPDLLVVDADLPRAPELVETLLDDPLTEPLPLVVVGTFRTAEASARFVALGVAKTLAKPVAPGALRRACDELLDARDGRTVRITLGEPTLEQLADRLGDELKRALVESVDRPARSLRVPLGEGTEVLGALWGAIARVQEIVAAKTGGAVRFGGEAPEGAVALAPWLHDDVPATGRSPARGRGGAVDVRLHGRRVVVVDDDPGVTWFLADLLRGAGCDVHEALDGRAALDLAFRVEPEVVISDILMPGLDGFALSRALHRDVALRDVPVILLSWKEDLLQRVRELGASAAAYMRKESDSRVILARVREVLRPRARIEARLRGAGEVRGRLDGITARLLLEMVGAARRDARVAVRDACFLYEVDLRGGHPRKATRTASDGGYVRGERALASLLGVSAGRFAVSTSAEPIRGELTGTLSEQLVRPLAEVRGALAATTGVQIMSIERIALDEIALDEAIGAIPGPARALVKRLAGGASPRQLLLAGDVSPSMVEDVLTDLAVRGVVRGVQGARGADLYTPAVDAALAALRGTRSASPSSPAPAKPSLAPSEARAPASVSASAPAPAPASASASAPWTAVDESAFEALAVSEPPPAPPREEPVSGAPTSLEDAVMRQLGDPPHSGAAGTLSSIVEPSQLRPRSSNPPESLSSDERALLPSVPPDAVVPAASSGEEQAAPPSAPGLGDEASDEPRPEASHTQPLSRPPAGPPPLPPAPLPAAERTLKLPSAALTARSAPAALPRRSPWPLVAVFGALAVAVGAAWRMHSEDATTPRAPSAASLVAPPPLPPPKAAAPSPAGTSTLGSAPSSTATNNDDVAASAELAAGYGRIEVTAPAAARVRIDGALGGAGPQVSLVAAPGYHEVRIEQEGGYSKHVVEVQPGRTTRVDSAQLP
jgi:DNA-binding response OmpR family regulator